MTFKLMDKVLAKPYQQGAKAWGQVGRGPGESRVAEPSTVVLTILSEFINFVLLPKADQRGGGARGARPPVPKNLCIYIL